MKTILCLVMLCMASAAVALPAETVIAVRADAPPAVLRAVKTKLNRLQQHVMDARGYDAETWDPCPAGLGIVRMRHTASGTLWWVMIFDTDQLRRNAGGISQDRIDEIKAILADTNKLRVEFTENSGRLLGPDGYGMEDVE